jgi:hypothetical protein
MPGTIRSLEKFGGMEKLISTKILQSAKKL